MVKALISLILWPLAYLTFGICIIIYLILLVFIPGPRLHPVARGVSWLLMLTAGQWLRVRGKAPPKNKQPYLYLFNHESMFDAFMLVSAIPHYITAVGANKQFSWPVWGHLVKRYGIIPIKRSKLKSAIHSLVLAEDAIHKGVSFIISPEGTRSLTGTIGPFKKGAFHVAKNSGITLVPVGIIGAFEAKRKFDWRLKPGILTVHFGDPITVDEYKDLSVEDLRNLTRKQIVKLVEQYKG